MTSAGSGKIWILVADWSRVKSSEPNAGDVTHKIGPLYFTAFQVLPTTAAIIYYTSD